MLVLTTSAYKPILLLSGTVLIVLSILPSKLGNIPPMMKNRLNFLHSDLICIYLYGGIESAFHETSLDFSASLPEVPSHPWEWNQGPKLSRFWLKCESSALLGWHNCLQTQHCCNLYTYKKIFLTKLWNICQWLNRRVMEEIFYHIAVCKTQCLFL